MVKVVVTGIRLCRNGTGTTAVLERMQVARMSEPQGVGDLVQGNAHPAATVLFVVTRSCGTNNNR